MIAFLLITIATTSLVTFAAATNSMFQGNNEWGVITACAMGGCFGSVVGAFFALFAKPTEWKWHIFGIRWTVNFCTSAFGGPFAYWYFFPKHFNTEAPSPILAFACGGVVGALGILLIQPLIPWLQRILENRANKFINPNDK